MAIACSPTPSALLAAARCISCLTPVQRRAAAVASLCNVVSSGIAVGIQPTGLAITLNADGTHVSVQWATPPSAVSSTEVWTSSDGVNYSLAASVPAPLTSTIVNAAAVGSATFVKIRWDLGNPGPFTAALSVPDPITLSWAQRVPINGGASPSAANVSAISSFVLSLPSSLLNKIKAMNIIAPDSLTAARTPLLVGSGTDPWTTAPFSPAQPGNLSLNGWRTTDGGGNNEMLVTGIVPSAISTFNTGNGGMTFYGFTVPAQGGLSQYNTGCNDGTRYFYMDMHDTGANPPFYIFACFNNVAGAAVQSNNNYAGYFSGNLVAANNMILYFANSTNPHAVLATQNTANAQNPPTVQLFVGGYNNNGANAINSNSVISFWAVHDALTASESQSFFNSIQALRTAFGGGFV